MFKVKQTLHLRSVVAASVTLTHISAEDITGWPRATTTATRTHIQWGLYYRIWCNARSVRPFAVAKPVLFTRLCYPVSVCCEIGTSTCYIWTVRWAFFFVNIEYLRIATCGVCLIINMVNECTCPFVLFRRGALTILFILRKNMFKVFFLFWALSVYCNRVTINSFRIIFHCYFLCAFVQCIEGFYRRINLQYRIEMHQ